MVRQVSSTILKRNAHVVTSRLSDLVTHALLLHMHEATASTLMRLLGADYLNAPKNGFLVALFGGFAVAASNSLLHLLPIGQLFLCSFFGDPVGFLNLARKMIPLAGDYVQLIVGKLAPLLLDVALNLLPITFNLIPVHFVYLLPNSYVTTVIVTITGISSTNLLWVESHFVPPTRKVMRTAYHTVN